MSAVLVTRGDARLLPFADASAHCCVTSPPYFGLRDYGVDGQLGLERTPEEYVAGMVAVFREVWRVLRDEGTVWLNIGDSYATNGGAHGGRLDNQTGVGAKRAHLEGAGDQEARRAPNGYKPKDLIGIPWMLAFALRADGWYLRSDIIWHKPNPMPESVTDRPTKAHEYLFLLSKREHYYYDHEAIREAPKRDWQNEQNEPRTNPGNPNRNDGGGVQSRPDKQRGHGRRHAGFNARWDALSGEEQAALRRNKRSVWTVATYPYADAHFATFPPTLIEPCILAGCPAGGTVLDPFTGSGTTGVVAVRNGRNFVGTELNESYAEMARKRIADAPLSLFA